MSRVHNFSAGPAALPEAILPELQGAISELGDAGAGIMELSHRGKAFGAVLESAEARLRRVLAIPDDYTVLFQQGGASMQFHALSRNLLEGAANKADYIVTGAWSVKALKEAQRVGDARACWSGKEGGFRVIPTDDALDLQSDAAFVHYTSNNTIAGTQFAAAPAGSRLVCDMSSDIASRPIDWSRHHIVYAGAQKNLGPSGVTVVILSPWALEQGHDDLPPMLSWRVQKAKDSMFNTPNTWGIFALERVLAWLEAEGGVAAMQARNSQKAALVYGELDRTEFWRPHAELGGRSAMNVTWRCPSEELEAAFVQEATREGLQGLKGHRSLGGLRASIYNAVPRASVEALVAFMKGFEAKNG